MLGFRPVRFKTANETSPNQRCTHMAGYQWGAYNRAARRRIALRSPSGAGLLSWPRALYSSGVMRRAWFGHEISSLLRNLRWTPDVAATTPGGRVRYPNVILRSLFVTNTDAQSTYSPSRFDHRSWKYWNFYSVPRFGRFSSFSSCYKWVLLRIEKALVVDSFRKTWAGLFTNIFFFFYNLKNLRICLYEH